MTTCPVEDTLQQRLGFRYLQRDMLTVEEVTETGCQRLRFGFGEVGEFDALADVERCGAGISDQVGGSGDTQQAEGEAAEVGIFGPSVVAFSDTGEELIGGEGEAADGVDLVDEDHQR